MFIVKTIINNNCMSTNRGFKNTAYFFLELFCEIEKWTKKNCPKSKIRKKFSCKKAKKTHSTTKM